MEPEGNANAAQNQESKMSPSSSASGSSDVVVIKIEPQLELQNPKSTIGTNKSNNNTNSDNTNNTNNHAPVNDTTTSKATATNTDPATIKQQQQQDSNNKKDPTGASETTATTTTMKSNTSQEMRLLDSLLDDVIFCECLQVHRAAKMGLIFTEPGDEMYRIKEGAGMDVFGQPLNKKKQLNCTCPQCSRNIAASRLAPHLEKCMGMGRLSVRAASNKRDTTST